MSKKVLIAYGTRFGSTEEVSQEIAKILEEEGIEPQLINLSKTKEKDRPSIEEFDGILVGSSIKINRWAKEPQKFLKKHKEDFKKQGKVLGVFVCSLMAVQDPIKARKTYLGDFMEKMGIMADLYEAFGGVLDFSKSSKMGFLDKKMIKFAAKGLEEEMGIKIDYNKRNDLRDWEQIRSFARKFAGLVED